MKYLRTLFILLPFLLLACDQTSENEYEETHEGVEEELLDTAEKEALANLDKNSVKYRLLGVWEALDDPTLRIEIRAYKYKTFDINTQVWDQAWDLADGPNSDSARTDENGEYILVYDTEGNAFYISQIISLDEKELKTTNIKGGREGKERRYIRIEK